MICGLSQFSIRSVGTSNSLRAYNNNHTVQVNRRNRDIQRNSLAHGAPPPRRCTDTHARGRITRRTRRRLPRQHLRSARFHPRRISNHEGRQSSAPCRRLLLRVRIRLVVAPVEPLRSAARAYLLAHAGTRLVRPVTRVPRHRRHPTRVGALSLRRGARAEEGEGRRAAVNWCGVIWSRVGNGGHLP